MRATALALLTAAVALASAPHAQTPGEPDWKAVEAETLRHFQALVQFDTSDPPGNEKPAADYLKSVLEREGVAVEIYAREPNRPNVVARIKGSGRKRPLLIMGHTDVVNVDPKKWTHPPFGAVRDAGHIYGRGTMDDKDNVTAALMVMLLLTRAKVALDRDVIFLAESGEEGTTRVGIELMTDQHFPAIDAEFCYGEGGGVTRQAGQVRYASVQTVEKIPRGIDLISRGISGHGSVPLTTNAVAHLAGAVARVAAWRPPITLNDTTAAYFKRLAALSPPEVAKHYRDVMSLDPKISEPADTWLLQNEPRHASMLRTSISPNIIQGGYRNNVIPSEARATLDVRFTPDEDPKRFLEQVKKVVDDPAVEVVFNGWPAAESGMRPGGMSRLDTEAYRAVEAAVTKHYATVTLPTMSTGATDMSFLRAKGIQCYGIGPASDIEDGPKGFGSHSDQERILESELHRFVRFHWDIVVNLARASAAPR
jgi:acetylornithine deacetylase/succinyl-diaminopimelate desuccinylase-like protein